MFDQTNRTQAFSMLLLLWFTTGACAEPLRYGYLNVVCPAGSDTLVSVPLERTPVLFQSRVRSLNPHSSGATVTPVLQPTWGSLPLVQTHYVRWLSGPNAGRWYAILAVTSQSLSIDTAGDTLQSFGEQQTFAVLPYWTLDELFPPASQNTIHPSSGTAPHQHRTLLLAHENEGSGIDRPATRVFLLTSNGWRTAAATSESAGSYVLRPGSTLTIRHPLGVEPTTFTPFGRLRSGADAIRLGPNPEGKKDLYLGVRRVVPGTLAQAALEGDSFAPSSNHTSGGRQDELLVFDNSAQAFNKAPASRYYKVGSAWFRDAGLGSSNPRAETDVVLRPATGLVLRKSSSAIAKFWVHP